MYNNITETETHKYKSLESVQWWQKHKVQEQTFTRPFVGVSFGDLTSDFMSPILCLKLRSRLARSTRPAPSDCFWSDGDGSGTRSAALTLFRRLVSQVDFFKISAHLIAQSFDEQMVSSCASLSTWGRSLSGSIDKKSYCSLVTSVIVSSCPETQIVLTMWSKYCARSIKNFSSFSAVSNTCGWKLVYTSSYSQSSPKSDNDTIEFKLNLVS